MKNKHIDGLPYDEFDYMDNNPDKETALAMEVIIQIGNSWDDGVRELTPDMRNYLRTALTILKTCENKTPQINELIKNGGYYLNTMEVPT